jgi:hypothetical protein
LKVNQVDEHFVLRWYHLYLVCSVVIDSYIYIFSQFITLKMASLLYHIGESTITSETIKIFCLIIYLVYPKLSVSLDCLILIVPSVFSKVNLHIHLMIIGRKYNGSLSTTIITSNI